MTKKKPKGGKRSGTKVKGRKVSKYIGVCWHKGNKRWRATMNIVSKGPKHVGYFNDDLEAARARDVAVMKMRCPKTKLNFSAESYFQGEYDKHQAVESNQNGLDMENGQLMD